MNINILLNQFENLLNIRADYVSYNVMMLPDNQYDIAFAQISMELNVDVNTLKQQFVEVAMTQLMNKQTSHHPETDSQENAAKKKVRQTYHRDIKPEYQQFQKLYTEKLFLVLHSVDSSAVFTNDRELCIQVNAYFTSFGQKNFWQRLQTLIPQKSIKQLREYYQKSFMRVLYDNQIDVQDKELLREMIANQKTVSPTDIAIQFLDVCQNKNYFQRNIVMYVINMRK
ncbi:Hypothetical_protein [Hexamita inflata]|uniref:Hypothetical_protein n=1 Tax=Hexamita inflata TaxID=28002 RepID=A0AA86PLH3_9EUKA|nr:Hypothetical protein HINF_LOCUS29211 [Hexamita inflata]